MKEKERFIRIEDSGDSIFTFDEADMIIDTKTNIVYGANNIPDLVKILNTQCSQWQKLKREVFYYCPPKSISSLEYANGYHDAMKKIYLLMQELEGEDE